MRTVLLFVCVVLCTRYCSHCIGKLLSVQEDTVEGKLVSVVALLRHGDRAPYVTYPRDHYFDISYWPMGHGQLTNKGKDRAYQLGKWLRNRYTTFLSEDYTPRDIYVRSTDVDRCLTSAEAVLASLYPPRDTKAWNLKRWQPIPIHTKPFPEDEILGMRKECDKYTQLYKETMETDYFKNITSEYSELFGFVSKQTDWNTVGLDEIKTLQTIFDIYKSYNKSFLPKWYEDLDKKTILKLAAIKHESFTHTTNLKRLVTGPFWSTFFQYFDKIVNGTKLPKFVMLVAHDTTTVALMNSMGVFDFVPPIFGATLLWELREGDDGYYVNVLYKRGGWKPHVLTLRGCDENCSYETFKGILEPVTVDSATWEEECMGSGFHGVLMDAESRLREFWLRKTGKSTSQPFFVT